MKRVWIIVFALLCSLVTVLRAEDDITLLKSAHRGNVTAMRKIGMRMYRGVCSRGDSATGIRWLEKAAEQGDADAMYYLGRIHMTQNKELGELYMKKAADHGNLKALAYQNKRETEKSASEVKPSEVEPTSTSGSKGGTPRTTEAAPVIDANSVTDTLKVVAATIRAKTSQAGVKTIAMVDFLCNGGAKNKLAEAVRDKMQEALLEVGGLDIKDRVDAAMLAQEGGAQREAVTMDASSAVLMGEVVCQPGGDIGFLIYRIFSMSDMRILAAGCDPVKWDAQEKKLLNGPSLKRSTAQLPFILKEDLNKVLSKVKGKVHCGSAMVHDGSANENNTVEHRVAFAQVLAALQQGGCALYEREFFQQAAQEASLSSETAHADKVEALCEVKLEQSSGSENSVKVKVTSYPGGSLLSVANISQLRGAAVGGAVGNNDENNLDAMLADINKEESDVQLVYEYECDITDDYVVPEEIFGDQGNADLELYEVRDNDNSFTSHRLEKEKVQPSAVRTLMLDMAKAASRKSGRKEDVKRVLDVAAIIGFCKEDVCYVGPLQLCMAEAARNLQFRKDSDVKNFDASSFYGRLTRGELKLSGKFEGKYSDIPAFTYRTEITSQGGLPLQVKCRVDFTPSKAILLKKTQNN